MPLFNPPFEPRVGVELSPTPDGSNRTFTTPDTFVEESIELFHNGRRLVRTSGSLEVDQGDFYSYESGGSGTGFDTIILFFTPKDRSILRANYRLF